MMRVTFTLLPAVDVAVGQAVRLVEHLDKLRDEHERLFAHGTTRRVSVMM